MNDDDTGSSDDPTPDPIPFARPWITDAERKAVEQVLHGHILTHGDRCREFQEAFADFVGDGARCVAVSSCGAALHLAYLGMDLGPGDEVVVPAMTHVATAHAVELTGARAVFADVDPATGNVDPGAVEEAITERTRALSMVHYLGIPGPMDTLTDLAADRDLALVEDCALAVGTRLDGTHAGLFGDIGCFSFYPAKHLTTGEGGMLVTRDEGTAKQARRMMGFGVDKTHDERDIPGLYDVTAVGQNYRLSELHAALGAVQMERIDQILDRRRSHFEQLKARLADADGVRVLDVDPDRRPGAESSHYCLATILEDGSVDRDRMLVRLKEAGVGCSVHYPHPVPRLAHYRERTGYEPGAFPGAETLADRSIALPVGPHLDEGDPDRIADTFLGLLKEEMG